jgi:hypothetical protein
MSNGERDFKPIKGCKHPLIVSGATPIGSASRAPDEVSKGGRRNAYLFFRKMMKKVYASEPILEKIRL